MPTLDWLTRREDEQTAGKAPYRLLEPVSELSSGDPAAENMLIHGDNLDALKALLPFYAGRVKCIYIDPPFNTAEAFEHYDDNLEHSIWLATLFPRLMLLKDLLSEDGSIYVHIDDNELGYLIVMMDEVLGRANRVSVVTFKQGAATGHKAINPGMVTITNYIAVYAKDRGRWKPNRVFIGRNRDDRYNQYIANYEDDHQDWATIPLSKAFAEFMGKSTPTLKQELGVAGYESRLNEFVLANAHRVIESARPDYSGVGATVRKVIDASKNDRHRVFLLVREDYSDMYFYRGQRWLFYKDKLKEVDGELVAGEPLTNLWSDLLSNNLHNEGDVKFPKGKKPESLIKRVLDYATNPGDLVLDSFLGSGTTAAVAHKMGRRYIGIELGEHAVTHCVPRLRKVIEGEQGGISQAVGWQGGGGYRFYRLGAAVFDEQGRINPAIRFPHLAAHVWFAETRTPLDLTGLLNLSGLNSPLLGIHGVVAYYLLYNGILGDRRPAGGNVLTRKVLAELPPFDGPKVIYGESCRLSGETLAAARVTFKQIPYDIKAR